MRLGLVLVCLFLVSLTAFGQVGNGTITGIVTDPAGAVVPGAAVEAKNTETGVVFPAVSTTAGNYTIPDLPVGIYTVTVKVQGFKTYTHTNLALGATRTIEENVALQVGNATEAVTVTAEASLLNTQSGELSTNITIGQLDNLPLLGIGTNNSGTSGYRNPYNVIQTLPGVTSYASSGQFTLNGLGGSLTETMRIDGLDATSRLFGTYDYTQMAQPSADSIQEIAFQTSNYAAEFGQAGSVVINMSMKSGTNQYHGSGYDYFVNEDLNAGDPFTVSIAGHGKLDQRNRRNDFGGTLGGPIYIPKVYNGHNKTFFFWNYEEYLETNTYQFTDTVPTAAYLAGNFSAISPNGNCSLCAANGIPTGALGAAGTADPLGHSLFANEIYDPATRAAVTTGIYAGSGSATPFPNNVIPATRFDPVTVNLQALINRLGATAQNANLVGDYTGIIPGNRYSAIPSLKIDHNISDRDKLSFYFSRNNTESQISYPLGNADGLPTEIGMYRGTFIPTDTFRLNYDRTLKPTLLLHLGIGYLDTRFADNAPFTSFNPSSVGLTGFVNARQFPSVSGMSSTLYGGMQTIGTSGQIQTLDFVEQPSYVANLTWIRGKHTYKIGGEMNQLGDLTGSFAGVTLATGTNATSEPYTQINSLNGFTQGFGYASWLLGDYNATTQTPQENYREGNHEWAMFIQDSWKVTRRLTVDYGIRWDFATAEHEQYGRLGQMSTTLANANAGGHPGATIYASTCGCPFYQPTYPYAIGPRIGIAYQINPKTVFRGGWGVNYQFVAAAAGGIVTLNGAYPLAGINSFVNIETPGAIVAPSWPDTDPNRFPVAGTVGGFGSTPTIPDANENRPPRINQWSASLQREVTRNFIVEAAYVANHAVWIGGPLGEFSQISATQYAKYGLYPIPGTGPAGYAYKPTGISCTAGNDCDRALLSQPLTSTAVIQKLASVGISSALPYAGFPGTSLASALYPFPQFGSQAPSGSATGDTMYNSLQIKVTKRLSHGLQAGGTYTYAKGFTRIGRQEFFNPQSDVWGLQQIPPQVLTFNATYTVPKAQFLNSWENQITRGWQAGFFAQYQSGTFLTPPTSTTANQIASEDTLVPGQPLYLVNINNIHSYNPESQVALNPAAWAQIPTNGVGPGAGVLYTNFRGPREPRESANIGRNFRIKERMNLFIRAEFVNIFNRTIMPNPSTSNPQNAVTHGAGGGTILTAGFGVMNVYGTPGSQPTTAVGAGSPVLEPRTGTLIARFTF
jgi:hypothetical protein